jgi:hypothetical protein
VGVIVETFEVVVVGEVVGEVTAVCPGVVVIGAGADDPPLLKVFKS